MGCDIHIKIQRQGPDGVWANLSCLNAPDALNARNYDTFGILANVRNGTGFAGCVTGSGWPSIADSRGLPPDVDTGGEFDLGDHSFTWVTLDELKAFPWDTTEQWAYGVVTAERYEQLSATNEKPQSYSGGVFGAGILVYEPDEYKAAKASGSLVEKPYVRMGWSETAREATYDWPGKVIPWLESLADGRPLRLLLGFDS